MKPWSKISHRMVRKSSLKGVYETENTSIHGGFLGYAVKTLSGITTALMRLYVWKCVLLSAEEILLGSYCI